MTIIYDLPQLWNAKSRATVELAAQIVGTALMPYTGLDAADSFERVFGTVHVRFTSTLATWAHASYGAIRVRPGYVLLPLMVHEMGHLFGVRAMNKPSHQLMEDKLDTRAGSLWSGMHPPELPGYSLYETWANLFADWAMHMLAQNPAGRELAAWMDTHMQEWCDIASKRGG